MSLPRYGRIAQETLNAGREGATGRPEGRRAGQDDD
jgi:hypothetical protein